MTKETEQGLDTTRLCELSLRLRKRNGIKNITETAGYESEDID